MAVAYTDGLARAVARQASAEAEVRTWKRVLVIASALQAAAVGGAVPALMPFAP